jgi:hypothetical protein
MTKFFFNFRQGSEYCQDWQGIHYDTADQAYLGAFEAALEMWVQLLRERNDPCACSFEVTDDLGRSVFVLPFSEVLDSCRRPAIRPNPTIVKAFTGALAAQQRAQRTFAEFRQELQVTHNALAEAIVLIAAAGKELSAVDDVQNAGG